MYRWRAALGSQRPTGVPTCTLKHINTHRSHILQENVLKRNKFYMFLIISVLQPMSSSLSKAVDPLVWKMSFTVSWRRSWRLHIACFVRPTLQTRAAAINRSSLRFLNVRIHDSKWKVLVEQKEQFKNIILSFRKLWWAFYTNNKTNWLADQ